jgi:hypothetical protein
MNKGYAWTADGKVRKWTFWLLTVAVARQFYFVQELLPEVALCAIGFAALAFVVLSLYLWRASRLVGDGWRARRQTPCFGWLGKT